METFPNYACLCHKRTVICGTACCSTLHNTCIALPLSGVVSPLLRSGWLLFRIYPTIRFESLPVPIDLSQKKKKKKNLDLEMQISVVFMLGIYFTSRIYIYFKGWREPGRVVNFTFCNKPTKHLSFCSSDCISDYSSCSCICIQP